METNRTKFQGVKNILNFNRHYYYLGFGVLILFSLVAYIFEIPTFWNQLVIIFILLGLAMPLLVSAYVYDYSGYYKLEWLENKLTKTSNALSIVNIHAGFDETSHLLNKKFPKSNLRVFDFYNPKDHTEIAIQRARKEGINHSKTEQISTDLIPLETNSSDLICLLSAAHEIRSNQEKVIFLKECKRILKSTGKVIMVEHLRDLPNFMAFHVGFTHFFSRKTWKKSLKQAGFSKISEKKFTPFLSIFIVEP